MPEANPILEYRDTLQFHGVTKPMWYGDPAFPELVEARVYRRDHDGQVTIVARQVYQKLERLPDAPE